jgi:hypothetical protein
MLHRYLSVLRLYKNLNSCLILSIWKPLNFTCWQIPPPLTSKIAIYTCYIYILITARTSGYINATVSVRCVAYVAHSSVTSNICNDDDAIPSICRVSTALFTHRFYVSWIRRSPNKRLRDARQSQNPAWPNVSSRLSLVCQSWYRKYLAKIPAWSAEANVLMHTCTSGTGYTDTCIVVLCYIYKRLYNFIFYRQY